ncbi:aldehyde dehydrogenase [Meredithblackwellia eburnea MCA 4105]
MNTKLFINNEFVPSASGETFTLKSPFTGEAVAEVYEAGSEDVEAAVKAAEAAWPAWEALGGPGRAACLRKLAQLVLEHGEELNRLETLAMGKPAAGSMDAIISAGTIEHAANLAEGVTGITSLIRPGMLNITLKQPLGVVAGVIPWNVSTIQFCTKLCSGIAPGNAIIIKSSEKSSLCAPLLCELCIKAGIPAGVVQHLSGRGSVGAMLASHPRIKKIGFTGSTRTGRLILKAAAESNLKRVQLELGGKSPQIVFEDADLEAAAAGSRLSVGWNSGQICIANARCYIHESVYDKFIPLLLKEYGTYQLGDPSDLKTTMGPMADELQANAVQGFMDIGNKEGKALIGGKKEGLAQVTYGIAHDSALNKNEVFGPVVVVHKFKTETEVLELANDTEFGLYGVWTKDVSRAIRVSKGLQAGSIGVNTTSIILPEMPFSGFKTSGMGGEGGPRSLDSWMEEKTLYMKIDEGKL